MKGRLLILYPIFSPQREVRGSAQVHSEEFKDCVAHMGQYIYDKHQVEDTWNRSGELAELTCRHTILT